MCGWSSFIRTITMPELAFDYAAGYRKNQWYGIVGFNVPLETV